MININKTEEKPFANRKRIRLKEYDYSLPGYYFVTICTQNRQYLFGNIVNEKMALNEMGKIINQYWQKLPEKFNNVLLDEYIIMPNHLHGIIHIVGAGFSRPTETGFSRPTETRFSRPKISLEQIIAWFKYQSTKRINHVSNWSGKFINNGREDRAPTNKKQIFKKNWQRNYYEHIIRDEEELNKIREYIVLNPHKWPEDKNNLRKK
ncbi:hypothetical protein COT63_02080 [Candidatus Shapirobacteria bacterium CG09_land_8_20_14_0_10_38_17]|uniref:Transposase IS200-like domain-containing protein n=1 Tax=Candidatus Shapirobacteria bacterium CG09_land_8_20_14_0_10_38_17 TaxID=1974884 RepID=A0A2H0WQY7_9BACT|nr:MAG: hypothetical protein COT63_02080 [Candidatus Shapirobacteria bacterium CG09_land_8_20_14_0_10_38_17]